LLVTDRHAGKERVVRDARVAHGAFCHVEGTGRQPKEIACKA
jgi:hypothetical protein